MFDIGWSELLVIAVVAIIFVGPRELIPMLRTFGQAAGKLRRMASEFQSQFSEALREAELDQVAKSVEEVRNLSPVNSLKEQFDKETRAAQASIEQATSGAKAAEPAAKPKEAAETPGETAAGPATGKQARPAARKAAPAKAAPAKAAGEPSRPRKRATSKAKPANRGEDSTS